MDSSSAAVPVVCTLTHKEATAQVLEWVDVQDQVLSTRAIGGGVRMTLPASMQTEIEDLARREAGCCSFLTIKTVVDAGVLTLDIQSSNPDALPVIAALSGLPLD